MAKKKTEPTLPEALAQIAKQYGDGAVMKMGEGALVDCESIPTGSLALDLALGIGGVPKGRIIEVYGQEASGKTTLCSHIVANVQKEGGVAAFIDVEHSLDPKRLKSLGVNVDDMYISQPNSGEEALNICETLVKTGEVDIIVVDSVAALVPQAEINGEMGDSHIGLQARLMSQAMRKLNPLLSEFNCTLMFTNQFREKVGVVFGSPKVTSGGKALKFYASVRIEMIRIANLKTPSGDIFGSRNRAKIVKNKLAPPFTEAEFDMLYAEGISYEGSVIDLAIEQGVLEKRGSWFKFDGEQVGQGKEAVRKALKEKPELCEAIVKKLN